MLWFMHMVYVDFPAGVQETNNNSPLDCHLEMVVSVVASVATTGF